MKEYQKTTDDKKFKCLVNFLFEAGMLRKTPRTGYQFLGTGHENVAEHSFRTAIIGYILAKISKADQARTVFLCLFHDFAEARTGDFNYVNQIYNSCDTELALKDATKGTGLEEDIIDMWQEISAKETLESKLAHDADQIDLIMNLKEELDLGNSYANKWLESALKRLCTPEGLKLAMTVVTTDHTDWWYLGQDESWWIHGKK